jgi:glycine dehydrogenase subunit 2
MVNDARMIFERSIPGRIGFQLPKGFGHHALSDLGDCLRGSEPILPEVFELDVIRHYTHLSNKNFGVETNLYPLGSCTMKYNPKINEEIAGLKGFNDIHPLQPSHSVQGWLKIYDDMQKMLSEISGLAQFSLNPYAGAHGELAG